MVLTKYVWSAEASDASPLKLTFRLASSLINWNIVRSYEYIEWTNCDLLGALRCGHTTIVVVVIIVMFIGTCCA